MYATEANKNDADLELSLSAIINKPPSIIYGPMHDYFCRQCMQAHSITIGGNKYYYISSQGR